MDQNPDRAQIVDLFLSGDAASLQLLKAQVMLALGSLTPRERKVLELRFGLEDGHKRTLKQVAGELNVTGERIRQIEQKALRKMLRG